MNARDVLTQWLTDVDGADGVVAPGIMQATTGEPGADFVTLVHIRDDGERSYLAFRAETNQRGEPLIAIRRFDGAARHVLEDVQKWMHGMT